MNEKGWPRPPETPAITAFLQRLARRGVGRGRQIAQEARTAGIHDGLVYLHDRIILAGLHGKSGQSAQLEVEYRDE